VRAVEAMEKVKVAEEMEVEAVKVEGERGKAGEKVKVAEEMEVVQEMEAV